ncbi:GNAT family N-acetyltransferase [Gaoshiqia sediminis]|uniref:GNAT family N-acetyltransferase n=1 Tax=Gaoshiqia sediminis TaxID=2986998 RepID=A0AA42C731_9BACT|nr:GNAT family N-acetyltransferase [Gaoshiqia sediminis]MCW0481156.1 GNAT family N-acetyltransferase [Gaoshiqia sediminis]
MNTASLTYGQVRFRPLEPEDLEVLYLWENDPAIWKVSNTLAPFSRFILKQYIQESHRDIFEAKQLRLIIENRAGKAVGAIDLFDFEPFHQRAGLGILIYDPADRGKGLATDSLQLMIRYAGETLGLHQLYANIAADNPGSVQLFEKAGFQLSGTKTDWLKTPDGWMDEMIYQKIL